jgi:hypothetical protein
MLIDEDGSYYIDFSPEIENICIKKDIMEETFNDPDPYAFKCIGIKKHDVKNKTIKINNTVLNLEENQIINPFFTGIEGGSVLNIGLKQIHKNYKYVYVLCTKNKQPTDIIEYMEIYSKIVNAENFIKTCENFVLIKAPLSMLKNFSFRKRANLVDGILLDKYFKCEKNYELDEIIIPLIELNEENVLQYINMYDKETTLDILTLSLSLAEFYNKYDKSIDAYMNNLILQIDTNGYWQNPKNCNINMDIVFNKRTLNYNGYRLDSIKYTTLNGAKTINNLSNYFNITKNQQTDNYLDGITDDTKKPHKSEHMNIFQVLKESDKRTFYATKDEGQFPFTQQDVIKFFNQISNEKYRLKMLVKFLTTKDICHFVINNKIVLQRNADLFKKYKPLFAYIFGYTWITFYLEESIFSTKSTKKHRFVYDHDTARELPIFPFSMENVHNNPYLSLLLNRDVIDPATNCMSIDALADYDKYYGLCEREEALKRFNCFVSGRSDVNIFKNLDSTIFSFSGSMIPACLQKRSPLLDLCTSDDMSFDDKYSTYFTHYYGESDIDVMCATSSTAEFLSHGSRFMKTLVENLGCNREDIKAVPNKKTTIIISRYFFKECIDDINAELNTSYTPEQLILMFNTVFSSENEETNKLPMEIMNYFYVDYVHEKNNSVKKWRILQKHNNVDFDHELVSQYNQITELKDISIKMTSYDVSEKDITRRDNEVYYFINDFRDPSDQVPKDKNYLVIKFSESIKYKLESSKLKRIIELFKIDATDPFNTVARFHKPCVRAYLQGDTFYMLPSFITAMMSMINIDYRYFAGSRDPVDIINKYRGRGYSVILNTNEKKAIQMYNMNVDTFNGMFKISSDSECFGMKSLNDKIFKPGVYKMQMNPEVYKPSNHKYIKNMIELEELYKKQNTLNEDIQLKILNFTAIGKNGNITPFKTWVVDAFYDQMNQTI